MLTKVFSGISLFLFLFLFYALAYEAEATAMVWTLVIPILPLFIILVGYNNWRNICPLSFFAKLSQNIYFIKKAKVPLWFERNLFLVQFFVLLSAFSLRIYCLNNSSLLLSIFLVTIVALAFLSGLIFTGKTWCNFFCPVSLVERIYTSSSSQQKSGTSACSTCSACKTNCPDIDMESSYWKEANDTKKKMAFYAFPGLVLGFYFYYYLQAGSWEYYFNGEWTTCDIPLTEYLFSQGFHFNESIPLVLAAPLTLIMFSLISYFTFFTLEYILGKLQAKKDDKTISHIVNVVAAFCAFNIFYTFAGAPTYSQFPLIYSVFQFIVVLSSSVLLYKEIFREEKYFLQEKFARKIIQKWTSKTPPSKNLKEIYYTYVNHQKDHKVHLEIYKETLEELFYNGILSADNKKVIDKFQQQFNITQKEHEEIITAFKSSYTNVSTNPLLLSSEKLYQLQHYKTALDKLLALNHKDPQKRIKKLKIQYNIKEEEHIYILNKIVNQDSLVHDQINTILEELIACTKLCKAYTFDKSLSLRYLYFLLDENRLTLTQELRSHLNLCFSEQITKQIFQGLHPQDASFKPFFLENFSQEHKEIEGNFSLLFDQNLKTTTRSHSQNLEKIIQQLLNTKSSKILASSLFVASQEFDDAIERFNISQYCESTSSLVKEIALKIVDKTSKLSQIEKEAFLKKVALFSHIDSNTLSNLASEMYEVSFKEGDVLVRENEEGDSLFVLTHGRASVLINKENQDKEIACIQEGDYVGEISIFSKLPRTATVKANTQVNTLELSGDSFKAFIIEYPLVNLPLMQEITKRLIELKA